MTSTSLSPRVENAASRLWTTLSDELDISPSLYKKAAERHRSLGKWFCRTGSPFERFAPTVRPQGSFRYGTVTRPLNGSVAYDLDQVVVLEGLNVLSLSQAALKACFGEELAAYAQAYGMLPPEEKHRCWCLNYRDEVSFHLDSLPSVPAGDSAYRSLREAGVHEPWALRAIAITDDRHPDYHRHGGSWLTSNPRGFARWFESRAALGRDMLLANRAGASVEDVPPYAWRTPLQRSIQILKRHRDVMFTRNPELAPISMIITNLAARAYAGERDLGIALSSIVQRMADFVLPGWPRVPNPTLPTEDYADKWRNNPELEEHFYLWLAQVQADVRTLSGANADARVLEKRFALRLSDEQERQLNIRPTAAIGTTHLLTPGAVPRIDKAARPWGAPRDPQ